MSSAPNAYLKTKIMTASPAELRLMLLEGAIRFAGKALSGLQTKNFEEVYAGITRAQDILMELINALKPEHAPDLCARLSGLYTYMYTQLMRASSQRDPDTLSQVIKLLEYERETWSLAMKQLASEVESAAASSVEPKRVAAGETGRASNGLRAGSIIGSTVSVQG